MSKPMATTLPWRTKPPERVRRIEIKSPVGETGLFVCAVEEAAELHGTARDICCPCGNEPVPAAVTPAEQACRKSGFRFLPRNLARLLFESSQIRHVIFLRTALAKEAACPSLDLLNLC
jgi:hypothetical protein